MAAIVIGITNGAFIALIALGYTMVYGIIELINFAHGDLFMLGAFLTLSLTAWLPAYLGMGLTPGTASAALAVALMLLVVPVFCATINVTVDRLVYKPLRTAPK